MRFQGATIQYMYSIQTALGRKKNLTYSELLKINVTVHLETLEPHIYLNLN